MAEIAYKMFRSDLTCTMGRGVYQYEPGIWYEELDRAANAGANGFHVAKNPLDCLTYYRDFGNSQCWAVLIDGDLDESTGDSKVAAQRIKLVKRLSLGEFVAEACMYIIHHPQMPYNANVTAGPAAGANSNGFAISVGPDARALGKLGDVIGILRTDPKTKEVLEANCFVVDGDQCEPGVWYDAAGRRCADDSES